jgi:phospho-N-acetylmuramoyl-pentapeptide-transferase
MKIENLFLIIFFVTFLVTVLLLRALIPILKSKKMGQKILEIGPRWHKNKEGTPTMGGISFVCASIIAYIVFWAIFHKNIEMKYFLCSLNVILYAILNAMVGIIDDFAKIRKSKNEGLTPLAKYTFQSIIAVLFLVSMRYTVGISTELFIPFFNIYVNLGFFYYILAYIALCGVVNSVNLTDGIDGLASSVTLSVGVFFMIVNFMIIRDSNLAFFSAILVASTLGFLVYNFYPAKIFMGDTGSLFLGALVVSMAFLIDNILLVLVYGFIFVIEAISDILQVIYFKATKGKRLFKMAPIHHHFEKSGFSEVQIVVAFTIVNAIFCFLAYFGLGNI